MRGTRLGSNTDSLEHIGCLEILGGNGAPCLRVPLKAADKQGGEGRGIDIFEDGIVWEDCPYGFAFGVHSTQAIRRATLSVNDHTELHTCLSFDTMRFGGDRIYRYEFRVDDNRQDQAVLLPFSLTCGFARVEVRIEFFNGTDAHLLTPDIVSLDEPRKGGQAGESDEEGNVREMFDTLTKAEGNQAAEWMFSQGGVSLKDRRLSLDKNTDWAYAPISMRLEVASDALHCIYDGLEDKGDAFPNSREAGTCPDGGNPHDTHENRAVRALLASMEDQVRKTADALEKMLAESVRLRDTLQDLVLREGSCRNRTQSLPALEVIARHVEREGELCLMSKDLLWRISEMLSFAEDPEEGFGIVATVPFHVPERKGLYVADGTYSQLHEAMRVWAACADEPLERVDVSLHAIKPDKLFEYSALHRMLSWLWENGFSEDVLAELPIDRFMYSLADWYPKYENDARCANTFHLVRKSDSEHGRDTHVDLYYQPVLYLADHKEENGLDIHRVPRRTSVADRDDSGEFWTPDYLLDIRSGDERRTYLIDAKYCPARLLDQRMDECADKYVARAARGQGVAGTGIDGVVLLAGRLSAPPLDVSTQIVGNRTFLRIIAPFNKNTGRRKMDQFFRALGLA